MQVDSPQFFLQMFMEEERLLENPGAPTLQQVSRYYIEAIQHFDLLNHSCFYYFQNKLRRLLASDLVLDIGQPGNQRPQTNAAPYQGIITYSKNKAGALQLLSQIKQNPIEIIDYYETLESKMEQLKQQQLGDQMNSLIERIAARQRRRGQMSQASFVSVDRPSDLGEQQRFEPEPQPQPQQGQAIQDDANMILAQVELDPEKGEDQPNRAESSLKQQIIITDQQIK